MRRHYQAEVRISADGFFAKHPLSHRYRVFRGADLMMKIGGLGQRVGSGMPLSGGFPGFNCFFDV